eukprot:g17327.t1
MTGVSSTNSGMVLQQAQTTSQAVGATCSGVQGGDFDIPVPLVVTLPSTMQIVLDSEEIGHLVDAVHSLHVDRILPDEKTLKARLKLRIKPNRVCILSHVLELYSEIKAMRVVMDHENGGPAIFLKDEPNGFLGFVDPCSNADPYPDTVWQHFENHLRTMLDDMNSRQQSDGSLTEKTTGPGSAGAVTFHRGRYGMAKDLYDRKLPFFEGLVLGQVCHIVELAIQRDLLHYENNLLLPAQACGNGMVLQQAQTTSQAVGGSCSGVQQGGDFDIPVPLVVTLPSTMQIVLDSEEIGHLVDAVRSLYVDRILPDEKTLKARLKLRIKPNRVCILSHVLELYSEIKSMRVVMDHENGGPAIFLKDEPNGFLGFVDPCSNADPYPDTVWQHFENHLRTMLDDMNSRQQSDGSLTEKTTGPGSAVAVTFHRGRYGMAKDLYDRKLPFFEGLALGQVCHIVELAIQRDLLHYENNLLLPAQACG